MSDHRISQTLAGAAIQAPESTQCGKVVSSKDGNCATGNEAAFPAIPYGSCAITITVPGVPQPGGSKRAFIVNGHAVVTDANPKAKPWKAAIQYAARQVYSGPLLTGPLAVWMAFSLVRPKGHYGSGRNSDKLKPSAPREHTQKPDVLKLTRAAEDALTGVVWRDDCLIVSEHIHKWWGDSASTTIVIESLANQQGAQA